MCELTEAIVLLLLTFTKFLVIANGSSAPNIIIILADDLGWNDVGFRGSSQIPTPNIDALVYNGMVLNRFYTQQSCTPSRAALLTGNYPIRSGLQGMPLSAGENRFIPLEMPILPEKLKELGYSTHLVGKWHLGAAYRNVTPTKRGFDTHYGYWNGYIGYFNYDSINTQNMSGLDLHNGFTPISSTQGTYATELFTQKSVEIIKNHGESQPLFLMVNHLAPHSGHHDELEVPNEEEVLNKYNYIKEEQRRLYAGIVNHLDQSVGRIVKTLSERNLLNNSIILFMSDNGGETVGDHKNYGSNWPLRGQKYTLYEGGVRCAAVIYSPLINHHSNVNNELIHISDVFPTLYAAAGGNISTLGSLDGVNQWHTIKLNSKTERQSVLLNIDDNLNYSGMIGEKGRYKLINGTVTPLIDDNLDQYLGDSGRHLHNPPYNTTAVLTSAANLAIQALNNTNKITKENIQTLRAELDISECKNKSTRPYIVCRAFCLFDLKEDPCETEDIAEEFPSIVEDLKKELTRFWQELVPQGVRTVDASANPIYHNGLWTTWLDVNNVNDVIS